MQHETTTNQAALTKAVVRGWAVRGRHVPEHVERERGGKEGAYRMRLRVAPGGRGKQTAERVGAASQVAAVAGGRRAAAALGGLTLSAAIHQGGLSLLRCAGRPGPARSRPCPYLCCTSTAIGRW